MSYEQDKTETMLFNDPEDMTEHELGLTLYHIGAHTILSREFTRDFMDKVVLRASQLLYKEIEWPKVPSFTYEFDMSQKSFEERMIGDWSIVDGTGDDFSVVYDEDVDVVTQYDRVVNKPHTTDPRHTVYGYCTCDRCMHDSTL